MVRSSIHILTVADCNDENEEALILNFINNTIGPYSNSPCWTPREFFRTGGPGIAREIPNCGNNAILLHAINPSELFLGNSQDIYCVSHAS